MCFTPFVGWTFFAVCYYGAILLSDEVSGSSRIMCPVLNWIICVAVFFCVYLFIILIYFYVQADWYTVVCRCLSENGWDYSKSAQVFMELNVSMTSVIYLEFCIF